MAELLAVLAPILLVDALNPVLFAVLVFAAGSKRPVANSASLLLGHTLMYFLAGLVISQGIESIADRIAHPRRIDYVIGGVVGLGLLWLVIPTKKEGPPSADEPEWELTPLKCLGFGAIVNFVGIPFALPYFGAVSQIVTADLSIGQSVLMLAFYNLAYALPFMVVPAAVAVLGDRAKPLLEAINGFLVRASEFAMPWLFLALGLFLVADSAAYFLRGKGLI